MVVIVLGIAMIVVGIFAWKKILVDYQAAS